MSEAGLEPKLLVVDDAPANIRLLRNLLKDEARVLFATSGSDALASAAAEQPDLILLDVLMPDMDGYAVCHALKSDPTTRDIPVIFVTGLADSTDETRGLEAGAIDYITKPFMPAIVRMRVRNHLALRRVTNELHVVNAELRRLATTDALTGVDNRRHFFDQVAEEVLRMRRYRHNAAIFMLDLDHFKRLNDGHGHDVGDIALVATASTMRKTLRTHDLLGRLGGEEFAGFLPETDLPQAVKVCERLREMIAAIRVPTGAEPALLSASIGVVAIDADSELAEVALKRADRAMYSAKRGGRNRVVRG
jgi:diguanylate cyclase (GGDEF)-like protein